MGRAAQEGGGGGAGKRRAWPPFTSIMSLMLCIRAGRSVPSRMTGLRPAFIGSGAPRLRPTRACGVSSIASQGRTFQLEAGALRRPFSTSVRAASGQEEGEDAVERDGVLFGGHIPFADFGLHDALVARLKERGKTITTDIQAMSIPAILEDGDVVIGSETGGGKTLAYMVPVLERAMRAKDRQEQDGYDDTAGGEDEVPRNAVPFAVVLVPNRQLCDQVLRMSSDALGPYQEEGVTKELHMRVETLTGVYEEWPYRSSRPAPDVLVCTPAFLAPFHRGIALFERIRTLVVDEADMLLEGDYGRQLDNILVAFKRADRARAARGQPPTQYVLSAATLPTYGLKSVEELVKKRFPKADRVSTELMHKHHPRLKQAFLPAPLSLDEKVEQLLTLLEGLQKKLDASQAPGEGPAPHPKTMVFSNTARSAAAVCEAMVAAGYAAVPFHKELHMDDRAANLEAFRDNRATFLVCTDLASRGLDIPDVKHVIQVEFAPNVVQHLHRIGRAVRAGRAGRATNFYDSGSRDLVESLQDAGDGTVDQSFSRQRGFRKKIKKYGSGYWRNKPPSGGPGDDRS